MINSSKLYPFTVNLKTITSWKTTLLQLRMLTKDKQLLNFSNHTLMIEQGRLQNTPRHERLYRVCSSGEIENEEHFAMSCNAYSKLKKTFTSTLTNMNFNQNERVSLADIMKCTDENKILSLSNFIWRCFDERDKCLETRNTVKT